MRYAHQGRRQLEKLGGFWPKEFNSAPANESPPTLDMRLGLQSARPALQRSKRLLQPKQTSQDRCFCSAASPLLHLLHYSDGDPCWPAQMSNPWMACRNTSEGASSIPRCYAHEPLSMLDDQSSTGLSTVLSSVTVRICPVVLASRFGTSSYVTRTTDARQAAEAQYDHQKSLLPNDYSARERVLEGTYADLQTTRSFRRS